MKDNKLSFDGDLFSDQLNLKSRSIDVVEMEFEEAKSVSWQDLFSGYQTLHAITYSSGLSFIEELLSMFDYAEIIFGAEHVISFSLQEVLAFQTMFIQELREKKKYKTFVDRIQVNTLKLYVSREKVSHEKTYLLEAQDGRKRVIFGSANMSRVAFSGKQRENICYIDGDKAFNWYMDSYQQLRSASCDNIAHDALFVPHSEEEIDELPIAYTVLQQKALAFLPTPSTNDDVRFVLRTEGLSKKLAPYMPKGEKGKILLTPETIIQTRRRVVDAVTKEKDLRSEYPQLNIDLEGGEVTLNGKVLNLAPDQASVKRDAELLIQYMEGFSRFHGEVKDMQYKYYAFANWMFASAFMAVMRDFATKYNRHLLPYPVFGLVYGQSKAGKTSFLTTMLKMMIGQTPKMAAPDFTRTQINALKGVVQGVPIIVDDLSNQRFNQHAIETIKNDDFGAAENLVCYPAVIISANEDVKAVAPEIARRVVVCHVQGGLTNTELIKSNVVRNTQRRVGTALYREYLRHMMDAVPDLIQQLKDDDCEDVPDILNVSAQILRNILTKHLEDIPEYVRELTLEDYFSEKVTGSQTIKTIQRAWKVNKQDFNIDKASGKVHYNAKEVYEAKRIIKELPEDLCPQRSREWVVMDINKAGEFFGINFKKRGLSFLRK